MPTPITDPTQCWHQHPKCQILTTTITQRQCQHRQPGPSTSTTTATHIETAMATGLIPEILYRVLVNRHHSLVFNPSLDWPLFSRKTFVGLQPWPQFWPFSWSTNHPCIKYSFTSFSILHLTHPSLRIDWSCWCHGGIKWSPSMTSPVSRDSAILIICPTVSFLPKISTSRIHLGQTFLLPTLVTDPGTSSFIQTSDRRSLHQIDLDTSHPLYDVVLIVPLSYTM